MEHEFVELVDGDIRDEQVINVDNLFGYRWIVAAEDECASFVVASVHFSGIVE